PRRWPARRSQVSGGPCMTSMKGHGPPPCGMNKVGRRWVMVDMSCWLPSRHPWRRGEAALAVARAARAIIGGEFIPELARDRLVFLVEAFTVIRVFADADRIAEAELDLAEPIRIGERLACGA